MWLLLVLTALPLITAQDDASIQCACTTSQCRAEGVTLCNTTGFCFSQWLDRRDGSAPLVRGCILSRTPLLCENRRPAALARHQGWPQLVCCDAPLCNLRLSPPTPPPDPAPHETTTSPADLSPPQESPSRGISPVYLILLGVGVCCFGMVIAIVGFLSRRHSVFCDSEFGHPRPDGYVRGCPEQPPVQSFQRGLENKVILDT